MSCCCRFKGWWLAAAIVVSTCCSTTAQTADSVYHRFKPGWTRYYFLDKIDETEIIDTSVELMHRYHPGFDMFNESHLGNLGQPSFKLSPQLVKHVGYRVGFDAYSEYMFTKDNTPFYVTQRPYTVLDYVLGTKNEQQFSGTHTQNISRQYNFNFRFVRLGSQGIFARQRADWFNLGLGQSFTTKNQRYFIQALVHQNRAKLEQNGGITIPLDSAYSEEYLDRTLAPVRFDSALVTMRERGVFIQHGLQWGGYYQKKIDTVTQRILFPTFRVQHRFQYNRLKHKFHDDSLDFDNYENVFIDVLKTNDSIRYDVWKNEFRLELTDIKSQTDSTKSFKMFSGGVGAQHEYWQFLRPDSNSYPGDIQNIIAKYDVRTNFSRALTTNNILRHLDFNLTGEHVVGGENNGDYTVEADVLPWWGPFALSVYAAQEKISPTRIQQYYNGNHFSWNVEHEKTTTTVLGGFLWFRPIQGSIAYNIYNVTNPIYFDANKLPAQLIGTVNGYKLELKYNIRVDHVHWNSQLAYQSYDNTVLNFPDFYGLSSIYYSGNLFKKALLMTAGAEARYNTSYSLSGFEPNTFQFYQQYNIQDGDYLWFDAFVNLKIRSVRVTLVGQNLLQGLGEVNMLSAASYPMPDRSFKLRVNWMFWN